MAENKKSFSLYTDLIKLVNGSNVHGVEIEPMTDEEAGQLFRWILEYVNDLHPSVPKDIKFAVVQVKKQLDDDLERWKKQCEINRVNGALGGRPRKPNETENNRIGFQETDQNRTKAKKPDKDKDKDKDINNNNRIINNSLSSKHDSVVDEIIDYLNKAANAHFQKTTKSTRTLITARLKEKHTFEDFKGVIDVKCEQWLNTELEKFLRPETLFSPKHFESYLNEAKMKTPEEFNFNNKFDYETDEEFIKRMKNGGFEEI